MRRRIRVRAVAAAAVVVAGAVMLAGCGSAGGVWVSDASDAGRAASPSTGASASWSPAVTATAAFTTHPAPTGTPTRTPTPTHTPTPTGDPPPPVTATPAATPTATPKAIPKATPSPTATKKPRTTLVRGDSGPKVLELQQRLSELGYWLGKPDGRFGSLTEQAVFALQKAAGIGRDGVVGSRTRQALADGIRPKATLVGDGVEIDLRRQLLLVVRGGAVRTVLNTSTGNGEQYTSTSGNQALATTPKGSFTVYRAVDGPLANSLGELWRPRFFHRGIAVHGSRNIPPWPASHGCARLSNPAVDMIWAQDLMPLGSRVVVR